MGFQVAAALAATVLLTAGAGEALAATPRGPGDVDPGFAKGAGMAVRISPPLESQSLAARPSGGVLFGELAIPSGPGATGATLRAFTRFGKPDVRFGRRGIISTASPAQAAYLAPDGSSFVARTVPGRLEVRKLDPTGRPDPRFGRSGTATITRPRTLTPGGMVSQADGKLLVVSAPPNGEVSGRSDFSIVRLLANGQPDPSFGQGGESVVSLEGSSGRAEQIAVGPDGRITAMIQAGGTHIGKLTFGKVLFRLTATGAVDPSFGSPQFASSYGSSLGEVQDFALDGRGRVLLAVGGDTFSDGTPNSGSVKRLTLAGEPDPSFGDAGTFTLPLSFDGGSSANAISTDSRDRVLVAGGATRDIRGKNVNRAEVARVLDNGRLDHRFGNRGIATTPARLKLAAATSVAVTGARIWLAGPRDEPPSRGWVRREVITRLVGGDDQAKPKITAQRSCRTRRLTVRVADGSALRSVRLRIDDHRQRTTRKAVIRLRISKGRHRLSVQAADIAGNTSSRALRLTTCR